MTGTNVLARIDHMLAAMDVIVKLQSDDGRSKTDIEKLAWERAFEILSEASRHVPDEVKATEPTVAWKQIAGLGNVLRHDYQSVNEDILENAASRHVPLLREALLRIIERLER